jgi:hypothetical protein
MKLFVAAAVLVGAAALAELRITSFNSSGELTWTNSIWRGIYNVDWADSPVGPWKPLVTVADLDWAKTNLMAVQVPLSNGKAFYRVAWLQPQPIGAWDYYGYDNGGTLVVTGQLNIASTTLLSSNPPVVYGFQGSWNLQYAGTETNAPWWLRIQTGTGNLGGTVEMDSASLRLEWPTNGYDDNIQLTEPLWPNTYTGVWTYITFSGPHGGTFRAQRR